MTEQPRILYCHCAYARVVPEEVKSKVLKHLTSSGIAFDAVADLCEMSARSDPSLQTFAENTPIKIAACYPRAVKWLFSAAKAPLPEKVTEVLNMRTETAEQVIQSLEADQTSLAESTKSETERRK